MKTKQDRLHPELLSEKIADAYSTEVYGGNWIACIKMLRQKYNFSDRNIEAILRSKWTRWAADAANKHSKANSADLYRWLLKLQVQVGGRTNFLRDVENLTLESGL